MDSPAPSLASVRRPIALPDHAPPLLFVVIDTEEEFDWGAPYSRANTSVTAMKHIGRVQHIFDRYHLKPTYVVDYPVAHKPEGAAPLREIQAEDRCTIGAHLHPWVTPPYEEILNTANSFACNLPTPLERAKIQALGEVIEERFGLTPRVYKAGRYGLGAQSLATLKALGYEVDTSINPHMDFSPQGGPSFTAFDAAPAWLTEDGTHVFSLPCSGGFVGAAGAWGRHLHAMASTRWLERAKAVGILSRLGVTNRVMLSPEGNSLDEMKALARALWSRGLRTFSLTFHSPSVAPGHTPYVRTHEDLQAFLSRIDAFCEFFFRELGGRPGRPLELRSSLLKESAR